MRQIKFRAWDKQEKKMVMDDDWSWFSDVYMPEIETENYVLMQSTPINDKNGKLIYEGDIVELTFGKKGRKRIMEISFRRGALRPMMKDGKNWEVIGNIYENPELTKN